MGAWIVIFLFALIYFTTMAILQVRIVDFEPWGGSYAWYAVCASVGGIMFTLLVCVCCCWVRKEGSPIVLPTSLKKKKKDEEVLMADNNNDDDN